MKSKLFFILSTENLSEAQHHCSKEHFLASGEADRGADIAERVLPVSDETPNGCKDTIASTPCSQPAHFAH